MNAQQEHNPISTPSHYTVYPVQPIAITRHLGFCLGNTVKYVLRAPYKNEAEDLRKALQYLEWEKATPSPAISAHAYRQAEQSIGAIIEHLTTPRTAIKDLQLQFLILLDSYLSTSDYVQLYELSECVAAMILEMEH